MTTTTPTTTTTTTTTTPTATTPTTTTTTPLAVVLLSPHTGTLPPDDVRAAIEPVAPGLAALLPDGASPVAALGRAVHRCPTPRGVEWVAYGRADAGSRWVRAAAERERGAVRLEGADGAECARDGALRIDAGIPPAEAAAIRREYAAARGGVSGVDLGRHVAAYLAALRAVRATSAGGAWLVDRAHADHLRALGAALRTVGTTLAVHDVVDGDAGAYAPAVTRTLVDEVDAATRAADAALARARAVVDGGEGRVQSRSRASLERELHETRERLSTWRDRLGLALGDAESRLVDLGAALDAAYTAALAEQAARRGDVRRDLGDRPRRRRPAAEPAPAVEPAPAAPAAEPAPAAPTRRRRDLFDL